VIDPRFPDFENTPASPMRPRSWYALEDPEAPPVVSIVTPFHSGDSHFHETARSVFAQSLQQWEWILVDDAAPSAEARATLDAYGRHPDPRIRVVTHDRQRGPGAARNTGFAAARAEFVYQLDDDDLIEPTTLEKTVWMLLSDPACGFANGWSVGFGEQRYLWLRGFEAGKAFLRDNLATSQALVRKAAHAAAGGYDETILDGFEDWDFWLRCASKGCWGATIPEYLDWYRRRAHHGDRWKVWSAEERIEGFRERLRERYGRRLPHRFPTVRLDGGALRSPIDDTIPFSNALCKPGARVLFVLPSLATGGRDKFNLDLVERLTQRGYEISIATTLDSDNAWAPEFTRFTADVFHLPNFLRVADHPRFLAYLIASRRPDAVVISHSELGYLLLPYLRARCPEPAYVDYCHFEEEDWKSGGYPRLSVAMQSSLDIELVSSQYLKGWMVERGADPGRIDVVHTNVDVERWQRNDAARVRLRAEWEIGDDEPLMLFAARLCEQKQPQILVGVFAELNRRGVPFRAVIAGDGQLREAVETSLRLERLTDRVRLLGSVRTAEMRDVMSACDLLLLPSRWEGIALSIFEAMAMGLVVVGADVGGQRELVTPECGILLPVADEETQIKQYADTLATLLRDDESRRAMGRRARERVRESFDLERMVDGFTGALDRALHAPGRWTRGRLPDDLAHAWAEQAVDSMRLCRLADSLWLEREQLRARLAGSGAGASAELVPRLVAEQRIADIEASRSWRTIQRLRRSVPYRVWRRFRLGPGWDVEPPAIDSQLRLARVEASRGFRLIQALKRNRAYGWYARRRWPDWEHPS
jgi:glycosyltransferase involved in cell wall biosynthesis